MGDLIKRSASLASQSVFYENIGYTQDIIGYTNNRLDQIKPTEDTPSGKCVSSENRGYTRLLLATYTDCFISSSFGLK